MNSKSVFIIGIILILSMAGTIYAQDNVMFNYQGRVKVQGNPFSGSGQFKFAIVNNAGNESLWSSDNTSTGGGEPLSSISISVTDGIFNALVGDTDLGMATINRSIFNNPDQIKLRIWFSDGSHGFQQLAPDHKLVNVDLLGMKTDSTDFTIYVNGPTGNDSYNGLSTGKAKKTIQAAVDILPERLCCNVTIDIADGTYREQVTVFGIQVKPSKYLTFLGDESWTPSSLVDPSVRITGNDDDITSLRIRDNCFILEGCSNIKIQGFLVDNAKNDGVLIRDGSYTIESCKIFDNGMRGLHAYNSVWGTVKNVICRENDNQGIFLSRRSELLFENVESTNNANAGILITGLSQIGFSGTGKFSNNGTNPSASDRCGIRGMYNSLVYFNPGYTGEIKDNNRYGIHLVSDAYSHNHTFNTITGNGTAQIQLDNNSHTY